MKKILLAVFVVLSLIIVTNSNKNRVGNNDDNISISPKVSAFLTQENSEGEVTVTAKPKILKVGEKPVFELELNTHSVTLDFDITRVSSLIDDKGNVLTDSIWDGAGPEGHHRKGTLSFSNSLFQTEYVELIIKNVAGVGERKFRWKL